jgi:N-acetylmuramoyl-L-alanine amidase
MLRFNFRKAKVLFIALPLALIFLSQTALAAGYTVVKGDSLYTIASKYNITVAAVKQSSNVTSNTLYPGQVLNIPTKVYAVKSGDTLYLIAKENGISLYTLQRLNNKWDNLLYPGQRLIVPTNSTSTSQSSAQSSSANAAVIAYTSSDLDLLARLITAEAGDQSYNAKVSVGAVVVNRVKSSRFPNTLRGVIYQVDNGYYQFTPVVNGWINKPATQDAKNAAYAALHGIDPTHGALYYFDDSTTNTWLWSKPIASRMGNMVYTY